jgi:hypothetical protein
MPRIHFPNFPLRLVLPVDRAAAATAGVKELVFRTLPSVNKARGQALRAGLQALVSHACVSRMRPADARCCCCSRQIEIRTLLERLYQLPVSKVATANVEGKKKRSRGGFYRRPDFKLAYVKLSAAVKIPAPPPPPPKEDDKAKAKPKA